MTTFLHILCIVGLVLLYILMALVTLILVVLIVPIGYKADFCLENENIQINLSASFLLFVLTFKGKFVKKFEYIIRCFGIKIKSNKENSKEEINESSENNINHTFVSEEEIPDNFDSETEDIDIINIEKSVVDNTESQEDDSKSKEKSSDKNKKSNSKSSTKSSNYDRIKKKFEIIQSERFKNAFRLCKKKLGKLLKHILPRKWKIKGYVGFEDPSVTGKILAFTGALYPWLYKHLDIKGDFEKSQINISGYFKGHIVLLKVIILAGSVYFNKNIRRLIKILGED